VGQPEIELEEPKLSVFNGLDEGWAWLENPWGGQGTAPSKAEVSAPEWFVASLAGMGAALAARCQRQKPKLFGSGSV
jgi:hypothetical protein